MDDTHAEPAGYLASTQTPDGVIHLISSRWHYRFNLAWLKTPNQLPTRKGRSMFMRIAILAVLYTRLPLCSGFHAGHLVTSLYVPTSSSSWRTIWATETPVAMGRIRSKRRTWIAWRKVG